MQDVLSHLTDWHWVVAVAAVAAATHLVMHFFGWIL